MNKTGIVIILLCFLAAAAVVLWERRKARKTMEEIERMLDAAMTGSFSETNFDESQLSALETKFAHYLSAAEASYRNVAQEKDKIKTLIADISHNTTAAAARKHSSMITMPVLFIFYHPAITDSIDGFNVLLCTKPFSLSVLRARVNTQLRKQASNHKNAPIHMDLFHFDFEAMTFYVGD